MLCPERDGLQTLFNPADNLVIGHLITQRKHVAQDAAELIAGAIIHKNMLSVCLDAQKAPVFGFFQ